MSTPEFKALKEGGLRNLEKRLGMVKDFETIVVDAYTDLEQFPLDEVPEEDRGDFNTAISHLSDIIERHAY